jgi:endoglucanase
VTTFSRRAVLGGALAMGCTDAGLPGRARAAEPISLGRGVNTWPWFSLTREYPAPRTDYGWPAFQEGRAVPRPHDLVRLRMSGLDFIRIPVDPGPFLSFDGGRHLALLDSLSAAVSGALSAGLSVVVDLHPNVATHYWTPACMIGGPDAPGFAAYRDLVGDLATRLAETDLDRVALEPVNEPPQPCGSPAWVAVQKTLLDTARAACPDLTLVATGACGSSITGLEALDPRPILALGRVIFTFHFYEPFLFSHQGAPWMQEPVYRSLNGVPWPAAAGSLGQTLAAVRRRMALDTVTPEAEKQSAYRETERVLAVYFDAEPDIRFIASHFDPVLAWAARHGVPTRHILLGEFGALRTDARYVAAGAADRARYVSDVRTTAEACGFPWGFWNLFDGMGLMDDATHVFDPAIMRALGLSA